MKIVPTKITNFKRSKAELELFWLFCLAVAGKNSDNTARCINKLAQRFNREKLSPFEYLRKWKHDLHNILVTNCVGQYTRIEQAIMGSIDLDLTTCSLEDLLAVHGVGNKTARFFLLHSRENCEHVVLDIHILRYLRERWNQDVPDNTPQNNKQYKEIADRAAYFIKTDFPHLTMAEADLLIWTKGSGRLENDESILVISCPRMMGKLVGTYKRMP